MNRHSCKRLAIVLALLSAGIACNLPTGALTPPSTAPVLYPVNTLPPTASTLITSTQAASPPPLATASLTPQPSLTLTNTPAVSATPRNPVVIVDSLCWGGPGKAYEVISTIRAGTPVVLLGRGIIDGWWVVVNPTYHDPCWLPTSSLQVDPAMDLSGLHTYKVPPTPTP